MAKKAKVIVDETTAEEKALKLKKDSLMTKIVDKSVTPPSVGDVVEGDVIGVEKSCVYINLHPYGTGIIWGKEFINARDIIKKINIGDKVAAKVVDAGNEEGYIELSLKEARQALIWDEAEAAIKNKTVLELPVEEANKGGFFVEVCGIDAFMPGSLAAPNKIADFQSYIGKEIIVMVEDFLKDMNSFIVSHKKYISYSNNGLKTTNS